MRLPVAWKMAFAIAGARRQPWRLADPLHAERVHMRIMLVHEDHIHDRRCISLHGHRVFREVRVRDPTVAAVTTECSMSAMPMPPIDWLRADLGFTMRPAP